MKKKLSIILAFVLAFCMSIPVFAAQTEPTGPSAYPTNGDAANQETTFIIQKNYVKKDGNTAVDKFPAETLKFKSECTAAPIEAAAAPNLSVADLEVGAVTSNIVVTVPSYTVPGKYNYKITEVQPSKQDPMVEDSAGVLYDAKPVYIQVVVKWDKAEGADESSLKKFVTVAADGTTVGAETNQDDDAKKKADFKNKYLLDGEIDPENPGPDPEPNPNPIPGPNPDPENPDPIPDPIPGPDPVKPIPDPDGNDPDAIEMAKFKVMVWARGPLASREQEFTVHVTLESEKPVRSDIVYSDDETESIIPKAGAKDSGWTQNEAGKYTATVDLSIKHKEVVTFKGVPAGVKYTVKEDAKHIGKLDTNTINDPSAGYTVCYYGGGVKVDNPTSTDAAQKEYGKNLIATGTVGKDTNNNIIVSNSKGLLDEDQDMVKPNTGINLDSLPYLMILGFVVLGAGMMVVKGRKRTEE